MKTFMFMVPYILSSKVGYFWELKDNDINKCTRALAVNQVCPRQIMTYVHSEIENGNAGPSPLFSRSLQFSERERKQKIVTQAKDIKQSLLTQPPKLIQITDP